MKGVAWRRHCVLTAISSAALLLACGAVKRDAPVGNGGQAGSTSAAGASGADGMSMNGSAGAHDESGADTAGAAGESALPSEESAGRLVLRRITNREYSNIMTDLIGDVTQPGTALAPGVVSDGGFEAPGGASELDVRVYNATADTIAETALAAGRLGLPGSCTNPDPTSEESCAGQFIAAFGHKAYRRPITADESADLIVLFHVARDAAPAGAAMSFTESVAQVAKGMLQSPNFLYHWELGPTKPVVDPVSHLIALTPHQIASRLAEMLWASMPDTELLNAADAGLLTTRAQVEAEATRMLGDARAAKALFDFHEQLLLRPNGFPIDFSTLSKSSAAYTPALGQAVNGEFTAFLSSVYGSAQSGTLQDLLTASTTYVNADLAALYGNTTVNGADFTPIDLDPSERAGLLTQTAFLAANADANADNPVERGLTIYLKLLCGEVSASPHDPVTLAAPSTESTTRQRFDQAIQGACATGCHDRFDPPGYAFENYDAIGAYRVTESGQAVDASGSFVTPAGSTIAFQNAIGLAHSLAESPEVQRCIGRQWLRYTMGRKETAAEEASLERAYQAGAQSSGYSLRSMLQSLVGSTSFRFRAPEPGDAP